MMRWDKIYFMDRLSRYWCLGAAIAATISFIFANIAFFFADDTFPIHDTGHILQVFTTTFAEYMRTGKIPEWLPFSHYGIPTYFRNQVALSPSSYLLMIVGKIFSVSNPILLFKLSCVFEVFVFSYGNALLSRLLLTKNISRLIFVIALASSFPAFYNFQINFRMIYLFPFVIYFSILYARHGFVHRLMIVGVLVILSILGEPHYMAPILALFGVSSLMCFCFVERHAWRKWFIPPNNILSYSVIIFGICLVMAIGYMTISSIDNLDFRVFARDPKTLRVNLATFVTYGGGGFSKTLELLMAIIPGTTKDITFYLPAPILLFAIYGFIYERKPIFLALAGLFFFFLLLCWGPFSPVAYAIYYIPGMSYFRHVGLLYAIPKLLFCLIAGFGVDQFVHRASNEATADMGRRRVAWIALWLSFIAVIVAIIWGFMSLEDSRVGSAVYIFPPFISALGFLMSWWIFKRNISQAQNALIMLIAVGIVQIGLYQAAQYHLFIKSNSVPPDVQADVTSMKGHPFEGSRLVMNAHPRREVWQAMAKLDGATYTELNGMLGLDVCTPVARVDYFNPGFTKLFADLGDASVRFDGLKRLYGNNPDAPFFNMVGCNGYPKAHIFEISGYTQLKTGIHSELSPTELGEGAVVLIERDEKNEQKLLRPKIALFKRPVTLQDQGISVTEFTYNKIVFQLSTASAEDRWFLYTDTYNPFWSASVDGRSTPVWRANRTFKAIAVPAGGQRIEFTFARPGYQELTWFIALGSLSFLILCIGGRLSLPRGPARQKF